MRVRPGAWILGHGGVWQQRQARGNHNRDAKSDQAVCAASIFSGSSTGGSGISSG